MAISRQYKNPLDEKLDQAKERKRGQGMLVKDTQGRLVEAQPRSGQEAAQLLGQQGPTTPLGVAQMGMSPDVAKMAGTPTQVEGAMKQQVEPQQTLQQAQRTQQGRQTATGEEGEVLEKSIQLQNLGSLGDRIHNLVSGQFNALQDQKLDIPLPDKIAQASNLPEGPDRDAALMTSVADWANEKIAAGETPTFAELSSMFPNPGEAIGALAGAGLIDNVEVGESLLTSLGYPSTADFEQETGITVPAGTTLGQFQDLVQQSIDTEFQETQRLQDIMTDPAASAQDRAAARQQLIDIGAVGLRGAEQAAHEVEQAVAEADDIMIGGERVSVEEALSDEYLSNVVVRAIDDPDFLAKLKDENPGFADFIIQNQDMLSDISQDIEDTGQALEKTKEAQKKEVQIEGLGDFNEEALAAMGIDLEKYGTEVSSLPDNSFVQLLRDEGIPAEDRNRLMNSINEISKVSPEFAQTVGELTPDEIEELGGLGEGSMLQAYADYLKNPERASKNDPALAYAMEGVKTASDLFQAEDLLAEHVVTDALGVDQNKELDNTEKELYDKYGDILKDGLTSTEAGSLSLEEQVELANSSGGDVTTMLTNLIDEQVAKQLESIGLTDKLEDLPNLQDRMKTRTGRGGTTQRDKKEVPTDKYQAAITTMNAEQGPLEEQLQQAKALQEQAGKYLGEETQNLIQSLSDRLEEMTALKDKYAKIIKNRQPKNIRPNKKKTRGRR